MKSYRAIKDTNVYRLDSNIKNGVVYKQNVSTGKGINRDVVVKTIKKNDFISVLGGGLYKRLHSSDESTTSSEIFFLNGTDDVVFSKDFELIAAPKVGFSSFLTSQNIIVGVLVVGIIIALSEEVTKNKSPEKIGFQGFKLLV